MSERAALCLRTVEASVTGAVHRPRVARRERDLLEGDFPRERFAPSPNERRKRARSWTMLTTLASTDHVL